jgi:hypothetical protein
MEKVLGIGGLFFRSRDPQALADWYATHLGVSPVPANYDDPPWRQQAGPTAFAPFPGNTRYFGDPSSPRTVATHRPRRLNNKQFASSLYTKPLARTAICAGG